LLVLRITCNEIVLFTVIAAAVGLLDHRFALHRVKLLDVTSGNTHHRLLLVISALILRIYLHLVLLVERMNWHELRHKLILWTIENGLKNRHWMLELAVHSRYVFGFAHFVDQASFRRVKKHHCRVDGWHRVLQRAHLIRPVCIHTINIKSTVACLREILANLGFVVAH
jgi:hypothetical protein